MSTTEEKHNYTYIVRCKDGTYYTGWTNNLEKRMKAHNEGRGGAGREGQQPLSLLRLPVRQGRQREIGRAHV